MYQDLSSSNMVKSGRRSLNLCEICVRLWNLTRLHVSRYACHCALDEFAYILSLQERSRNKLKDFLTMGPALHVSHIMAFTLTPLAPSLRVVKLSDGPTLSFRIERYSLMKDVMNTSRRAHSVGMEYLSPPLVRLRVESIICSTISIAFL